MPIITKSGKTLADYMRGISDSASITEGDVLYAMAHQAQRVQERTCQGVDYRNQAFAPYSTKGPYHHSPGRADFSRKRNQSIALHHQRYYGGSRKRGGTTVRYGSYSDYKQARNGGTVDLGGMEGSLLSNIEVGAGDGMHSIESAAAISPGSYLNVATKGLFGIYVEPAARIAAAHNQGAPSRHLPQREFLGISESDEAMIFEDIAERVQERLNRSVSEN